MYMPNSFKFLHFVIKSASQRMLYHFLFNVYFRIENYIIQSYLLYEYDYSSTRLKQKINEYCTSALHITVRYLY